MSNKVLIGVSGGPDSMYLLDKMYKEGKHELLVAHVNYHLRDESDMEQAKLEQYCSERDISIEVLQINDEEWDKVSHLKNKQSMTREQRYNFYLKLCKEHNIEDLYIAHHKDDFLETAIMQERRSNDFLFYGIKPLSIYRGINVHRPLLDIYKEDIIASLEENNVPYSIDKSNLEPIYDRNRLRIELSDKTKEEKDTMVSKYVSINKDKEQLELDTNRIYKEWMDKGYTYDYYIDISDELKKYVLYRYLINAEDRINISSDKLKGMIEFLETKKGDKQYRLMENIYLGVKSNIITIIKR